MGERKGFNYWNLAINVLLALFVLAAAAFVRDIVTKELKGYVPRQEFEDYQKAHRAWGDEVLKNIDSHLKRLDASTEKSLSISQENNILLRELRAEMRHLRAGVGRLEDTVVAVNGGSR